MKCAQAEAESSRGGTAKTAAWPHDHFSSAIGQLGAIP